MSYHKPKKQRNIALERIRILFEKAKERSKTEPNLSKRYVALARKIGMRYKVSLPSELKRRFCRKCGIYFDSKNSTTRLRNGLIIFTCKECGSIRRFRYK